MHLFTYGSLMYPAVWNRVVRGRYRGEPAELAGFERCCVRGEPYPGLRPGAATARVEGVLYRDLSRADLLRLDRFEGDYYRREPQPCRLADGVLQAGVYLFRPEYHRLLEPRAWDPAQFERAGLAAFIARYRGFGPPQ